MSRNLQEKLEKYHHTKGMHALLNAIAGLNVIAFPVERIDFGPIEIRISDAYLKTSLCDSSLTTHASPQMIADWIAEVLANSLMQDPIASTTGSQGNAYLRTSDFYAAGWAEIKSDRLDQVVYSLWQHLMNKELYIVSQNLTKSLILHEDEHEWEAFWSDPIRHSTTI
jgi:hypothetical protein